MLNAFRKFFFLSEVLFKTSKQCLLHHESVNSGRLNFYDQESHVSVSSTPDPRSFTVSAHSPKSSFTVIGQSLKNSL